MINKYKRFKQGDILLVDWLDASSSSRWHTDNEIEDFAEDEITCHNIGYLQGVTNEMLVLYSDWTDWGQKGLLMSIPLSTIKKIELLRKHGR